MSEEIQHLILWLIPAAPLISAIVKYEELNLFNFIYNSLRVVCDFLELKTKIVVSSEINIDHTLRSQDKVIALV